MAADIGSPATPATPDPERGPATAEEVEAAWADTKLAQVLYHDWESGTYDEKWSISFDQRCVDYATERFTAVAGRPERPYARSLEIGAGTGFFTLNLMLGGLVEHGSVSDISPGMVEVARRNAATLGLPVDGKVADAETLPWPDDSFDLVIGHAVIHHIPDVGLAFREMLRVLRPGGRIVIAGEPTRRGDKMARALSRATWAAATTATRLPLLRAWARPKEELDESSRAAALEAVVDLHTFEPRELEALVADAGFTGVATHTDELTASWLGWPMRTLECAVPQEKISDGWRWFAYRSWIALGRLDEKLHAVVDPGLYYNVSVTGTKPK